MVRFQRASQPVEVDTQAVGAKDQGWPGHARTADLTGLLQAEGGSPTRHKPDRMRCGESQVIDGLPGGVRKNGRTQLATGGRIDGEGAPGIGSLGLDSAVFDVAVEASKQGVDETARGRGREFFGLLDGFVHRGEGGDSVQIQELVCPEKQDGLEFTVDLFPFAA